MLVKECEGLSFQTHFLVAKLGVFSLTFLSSVNLSCVFFQMEVKSVSFIFLFNGDFLIILHFRSSKKILVNWKRLMRKNFIVQILENRASKSFLTRVFFFFFCEKGQRIIKMSCGNFKGKFMSIIPLSN